MPMILQISARLAVFGTVVLVALPGRAAAQRHDQHSQHAGNEARDIKALSPEDIAALLAGEGMGMALPAELNRYPGPRHVLDLAAQLGLAEPTVAQVRAIHESMHTRAVQTGTRYVEAERALDRFFAERGTDDQQLRALIADTQRLRGELRFIHLQAHILTTSLLTPEQIRRYDELRGYTHRHSGG